MQRAHLASMRFGAAVVPMLSAAQPPLGAVASIAAGTVSVNLTDANTGTLSDTVNGVAGTKNITRQLF